MGHRKGNFTDFGKMVKKRLIDMNMTQVELSQAVGTSKQYMYDILTGKKSGRKYIDRIKAVLKIEDVA